MDYEKNNEALDIVKRMVADGQVSQEVAEKYFPELVESDNERIRKELIAFLKENLETGRADETWSMSGLERWIAWLEKQGEQKPNPYSGTSFEYNGHTWGMCARDGGVEILIDGHIKGRVSTNDSNAKEMFIKALERVEEQNAKGYKLTDSDKNSWWEDFKVYTSCTIEQKPVWSEEDEEMFKYTINLLNYNLGCRKWIKSLKFRLLSPSIREFDKEEGRIIDHLIAICDDAMCYKTFAGCYDIEKCKNFLTNLKFGIQTQTQTTWKPSIAQLNALSIVSKGNAPDDIEAIVSLYNDLKKL